MKRRATYQRPRSVDPYWILVCCLLGVLLAFGLVGVLGS